MNPLLMHLKNLNPKITPALLAFGIAFLIEALFTIDWSYPYCYGSDSGPAPPVTGMPLPYMVPNTASSGHVVFMPHVYLINLLLLAIPIYLLWQPLFTRYLIVRTKVGVVANSLAFCLLAAIIFVSMSLGYLTPVTSIANSGFMTYRELRPISIGFKRVRSYDCIPSPFWFPDGWKPR